MGEKIYVGTLTLDDAEPATLVIPALDLNAPVEELQGAIEAAEAQRAADREEASRRLRGMFLPGETKAEDKPPKPIARDWMIP